MGSEFHSAEQALQYTKAMFHNEFHCARMILFTDAPADVSIARMGLTTDQSWDSLKCDVMMSILKSKARASQSYVDCLMSTGNDVIVEADVDLFWASGLPSTLMKDAPQHVWPGENKRGKIQMELRRHLQNEQGLWYDSHFFDAHVH